MLIVLKFLCWIIEVDELVSNLFYTVHINKPPIRCFYCHVIPTFNEVFMKPVDLNEYNESIPQWMEPFDKSPYVIAWAIFVHSLTTVFECWLASIWLETLPQIDLIKSFVPVNATVHWLTRAWMTPHETYLAAFTITLLIIAYYSWINCGFLYI